MTIQIRLVAASDLPELATLFHQTVLAHAPQKYTAAQTEAWAAYAMEVQQFRSFILTPTTYVAEDDTGIVGFAGIAATGHVSAVYVRGDRLRQGIGSCLMHRLLDHAIHYEVSRLYAEASEFSLGLFQKFGFRHYDTEVVDRNGVQFTRYLVERHLKRGAK